MAIFRLKGFIADAEVLGVLRTIEYRDNALVIADVTREEVDAILGKLASNQLTGVDTSTELVANTPWGPAPVRPAPVTSGFVSTGGNAPPVEAKVEEKPAEQPAPQAAPQTTAPATTTEQAKPRAARAKKEAPAATEPQVEAQSLSTSPSQADVAAPTPQEAPKAETKPAETPKAVEEPKQEQPKAEIKAAPIATAPAATAAQTASADAIGESLKKCVNLRNVLSTLMDAGFKDYDAILAQCTAYQAQVPTLKVIGANLPDRVKRTLMAITGAEA